MPRTASTVGLARRGVNPTKQFDIKVFVYNTVILVANVEISQGWQIADAILPFRCLGQFPHQYQVLNGVSQWPGLRGK